MADSDSKEVPQFNPYRWEKAAENGQTVCAKNYLRFAERVHRVTMGVNTALELASEDGENAKWGYPHFLRPFDRGALMYLAQEAVGMLNAEAETIRDWFDDHHTKSGRLSRYNIARDTLKQHKELPESP